jgi:glycosyltransferase involved in cell wall biosynthesis
MLDKQHPILFIHNTYLFKGGEGVVVNNEMQILKDRGYTVLYKEYTNANFKSISFKTLLAPINTIFNIFSFCHLYLFVKLNKIKIVHVHNVFYTASPSVFWAAKLAGAKTVLTIHNYRLFCLSANFFRDDSTCFICQEKNSFKNGIANKCFKKSTLASFILASSIRWNDIIGTWKNKVDHYVVLNEFTESLFIKKGIAPNKIHFKRNFLLHQNKFNPAVATPKEDFYLFAGRLMEEKGIRHLIEAFQKNNKKLVIAGTGELVEWVKSLDSPNIQYLGQQNQEQILDLLYRCKALIFSSIWIESMPMTIIEAQMMGTIPIVAKSINTNKMIENGIDGLLYDPNERESLINIIEHFESLTSEQLAKLSINARNKSLNIYSEERHLEKMLEIYNI